MYNYDFTKKEEQRAAQKYDEYQRRERFKRAAQPFIQAKKDFWTFAGSYPTRDGDQQLYEELRAEMKHQQDLDEAFLRGFQMGSNAPVQRRDDVKKVIG